MPTIGSSNVALPHSQGESDQRAHKVLSRALPLPTTQLCAIYLGLSKLFLPSLVRTSSSLLGAGISREHFHQ
jgi:hypothetical protein